MGDTMEKEDKNGDGNFVKDDENWEEWEKEGGRKNQPWGKRLDKFVVFQRVTMGMEIVVQIGSNVANRKRKKERKILVKKK